MEYKIGVAISIGDSGSVKEEFSPASSDSGIDSFCKVVKLGDSGDGITSSGRHSCEFIDGKGKQEGWVCLGGDFRTVVEECLLAVESLEVGRS